MWRAHEGRSNRVIANTATLAVGALGRTLTDRDPERAQEPSRDLVYSPDAAASAEESAMLLKALGNTGDPHVASVIAAHVNAEEGRWCMNRGP